ncbi:MAG: DNA polymerase IV [Kiritimatiellia bacterium]
MRTILHVDMDAFFAAVEQRENPALRGKPVVVGAAGDARGVVAAASYEARKYGIHSAMPSREAFRLCPDAVFVSPRHAFYTAVSRDVFAIFERYTPEVEPLSIDEAFLDVSGSLQLFGAGAEIAEKIRSDIWHETGLTASAGVAPNKFLAKIASEMHKPDGLTVVPVAPLEIQAFLAPLSVGRIWGVGPVLESKLRAAGLRTIGDLQFAAPEKLETVCGKHTADHLRKLAFGEDTRPVETANEEKSISREHTFGKDVRDPVVLVRTLGKLVADVGQRLRSAGYYAGTARIKIRWQGFRTNTRQCVLDPPCCDDFQLRAAAQRLLQAETLRNPVRLIGFGVQDLQTQPSPQLRLFDAMPEGGARKEKLSRTMDQLRARFGDDSIGIGAL